MKSTFWRQDMVMLAVEHNDPTNEKILAISEDKIAGFVREPFEAIAKGSGWVSGGEH